MANAKFKIPPELRYEPEVKARTVVPFKPVETYEQRIEREKSAAELKALKAAREAVERGREAGIRYRIAEMERQLCTLKAEIKSPGYLGAKPKPVITYAKVEYRICRAMGVSIADVRSPRRTQQIVLARFAICYWCYRLTTYSMPQIGRFMGGKDHTTILHAVARYPELRFAHGRHLKSAKR